MAKERGEEDDGFKLIRRGYQIVFCKFVHACTALHIRALRIPFSYCLLEVLMLGLSIPLAYVCTQVHD